ncbi:factor H binding protein domain-containing protein [Basilea psittacipulmonis]|uniref:Factor H binding protein-like C-terminal domain-containing protein n=1 Tax=Basilea psittacipulmonis DSM 24701 TaxID=1072685 RepID=A0A077DC22_9BURK|nr:factor H binding protein domain-containing protein [Basilea psittacipulmonis]AIL32199.1 hypothetical protein IX83_01720 [Basilea psittacipulmonis DSM 24701]
MRSLGVILFVALLTACSSSSGNKSSNLVVHPNIPVTESPSTGGSSGENSEGSQVNGSDQGDSIESQPDNSGTGASGSGSSDGTKQDGAGSSTGDNGNSENAQEVDNGAAVADGDASSDSKNSDFHPPTEKEGDDNTFDATDIEAGGNNETTEEVRVADKEAEKNAAAPLHKYAPPTKEAIKEWLTTPVTEGGLGVENADDVAYYLDEGKVGRDAFFQANKGNAEKQGFQTAQKRWIRSSDSHRIYYDQENAPLLYNQNYSMIEGALVTHLVGDGSGLIDDFMILEKGQFTSRDELKSLSGKVTYTGKAFDKDTQVVVVRTDSGSDSYSVLGSGTFTYTIDFDKNKGSGKITDMSSYGDIILKEVNLAPGQKNLLTGESYYGAGYQTGNDSRGEVTFANGVDDKTYKYSIALYGYDGEEVLGKVQEVEEGKGIGKDVIGFGGKKQQ